MYLADLVSARDDGGVVFDAPSGAHLSRGRPVTSSE